MNYLIWKGEDSRDIKGLIISELPPISKPLMRVVETVIDGVDGSMIEEVGYSSYDKAMTIGITPNADINEVIAYFTGNGEVVFSNEADKCYKASIIGQIDFARLVRFRVATVVFRVQPFKYEYFEKQSVLPSGEIAGGVIQLTDKKITELAIEGRSTQNGTPAPNAPIEIESISGDVAVKSTGKNLFSGFVKGQRLDPTNGNQGNDPIGATSDFIRVDYKTNTCYRLSGLSKSVTTFVGAYNEKKEFLKRSGANPVTDLMLKESSFSGGTPQGTGDIAYLKVTAYENSSGEKIDIVDALNIQLEQGEEITDYEPYKENTVTIHLAKPLRSLPNGVKDVAYIKNDALYIDRYVGEIVLDGTETWGSGIFNGMVYFYTHISNATKTRNKNLLSNRFVGNLANAITGFHFDNGSLTIFNHEIATTVEEFKTWLSQNNVEVVYELLDARTEEIETETLLLFEDTNNISNSADANMVITYIDNKIIVDNVGNYTAKPIMEIKGSGEVVIAVNGNTLFRYTFPDGEDTVIIDSQKQDAYLGAVLKNRNMSGEFPTFSIGENVITWDGTITSIKISAKSRWL